MRGGTFALACLMCVTGGCATTSRMYGGKARPPKETAELIRGREPGALTVEQIDGEPADGTFSFRYEVLPGRHRLKVRLDAYNAGEAHFRAEAGHRYFLRVELEGEKWRPYVEDGGSRKPEVAGESPSSLRSACRAGMMSTCVAAARIYADGISSEGWNEPLAESLFQKACAKGDQAGCIGVADMIEAGHGSFIKDPFEAARMYERACPSAPDGCNRLGILYQQGIGYAQNDDVAEAWYRKACDGGLAKGCYNLALLYRHNHLDSREPAKGLYEKACDGGELSACTHLAEMLLDGVEARPSGTRAIALYGKACDGGEPWSCNSLGQLYEDGGLVEQDDEAAVGLYRKACDGSLAEGCANLGTLYALGLGVARDDERAVALLSEACHGGVETACTRADILKVEREESDDAPRAAARSNAKKGGRR